MALKSLPRPNICRISYTEDEFKNNLEIGGGRNLHKNGI